MMEKGKRQKAKKMMKKKGMGMKMGT